MNRYLRTKRKKSANKETFSVLRRNKANGDFNQDSRRSIKMKTKAFNKHLIKI